MATHEHPDLHKPLYHIYIFKSKGKSILRVANVFGDPRSMIFQHTGSWVSRNTARWWALKITKETGEKFLIIKCEIPDCPVCKKKRSEMQAESKGNTHE